jgi:hypothetical protein
LEKPACVRVGVLYIYVRCRWCMWDRVNRRHVCACLCECVCLCVHCLSAPRSPLRSHSHPLSLGPNGQRWSGRGQPTQGRAGVGGGGGWPCIQSMMNE